MQVELFKASASKAQPNTEHHNISYAHTLAPPVGLLQIYHNEEGTTYVKWYFIILYFVYLQAQAPPHHHQLATSEK